VAISSTAKTAFLRATSISTFTTAMVPAKASPNTAMGVTTAEAMGQ